MNERAWFKVPDGVGAITFGGVPVELRDGIFEVAESDVERVLKEIPIVTRVGEPSAPAAEPAPEAVPAP